VDEKVALVDTVKSFFFPEMMRRIRNIVDPIKIDYLISNHTEPDHSGAISKFLEVASNAELVASEPGRKGLKRYYGDDLECTTIKERPNIDMGKRTLQFVPVPMVHWPDSMVTYIPEEKLLLSSDAFGQHFATSKRFDDEVDRTILMHEAKKYYANIVMHLWRPVDRALKALAGVEIDMIAPSHGVIWRDQPDLILTAYRKWVDGVSDPRVVIVYDAMWGSTEMLANALVEGIMQEGVEAQLYRLNDTHNSEVITSILDAKVVLIGSPTINNGLFPTVSSFLTYMKGLRPRMKLGAFFGSYGWGGGAKREAEAELQAAGIELIESNLVFTYRPSEEELKETREFGRRVAKQARVL
jgi:flavorubredoxin